MLLMFARCVVVSSLSKHFPALLERSAGRQTMTADQLSHHSLRVLVPLCGKTVDMMW